MNKIKSILKFFLRIFTVIAVLRLIILLILYISKKF